MRNAAQAENSKSHVRVLLSLKDIPFAWRELNNESITEELREWVINQRKAQISPSTDALYAHSSNTAIHLKAIKNLRRKTMKNLVKLLPLVSTLFILHCASTKSDPDPRVEQGAGNSQGGHGGLSNTEIGGEGGVASSGSAGMPGGTGGQTAGTSNFPISCAKVEGLCVPDAPSLQCCPTGGELLDSTKDCWSDFLECAQFVKSKECVWGDAGTCLYRSLPNGEYQILRTVDTPLTGEAEPLGFGPCTLQQKEEMGKKFATLPKCSD